MATPEVPVRHRRALLFVAAVALALLARPTAREQRLPASRFDRPLPARVDVEMIPEVEVLLPARRGGFVSPAECWSWPMHAKRDDRLDRPPAVADAAANLARRAPIWVRSGLAGLGATPARIGAAIAEDAPRTALALLELDEHWYRNRDSPTYQSLAEALYADPDPVVAGSASFHVRSLDEADLAELYGFGATEGARFHALLDLCREDPAWTPEARDVLRRDASAARDGELRIRASLALLRDAWLRDDREDLAGALDLLTDAQGYCRAGGWLADDPRLRRDPADLDALDPPLGPAGMAALAAQLEPEFAVLDVDCSTYPCVVTFTGPGPFPVFPPGVWLVGRDGMDYAVAVGPGWSDRDASDVVHWRLERPVAVDSYDCLDADSYEGVRAQVLPRLTGAPAPGWRASLRAAVVRCADPPEHVRAWLTLHGDRWEFASTAPETQHFADCVAAAADPTGAPGRVLLEVLPPR